jgi:hypothetical protein
MGEHEPKAPGPPPKTTAPPPGATIRPQVKVPPPDIYVPHPPPPPVAVTDNPLGVALINDVTSALRSALEQGLSGRVAFSILGNWPEQWAWDAGTALAETINGSSLLGASAGASSSSGSGIYPVVPQYARAPIFPPPIGIGLAPVPSGYSTCRHCGEDNPDHPGRACPILEPGVPPPYVVDLREGGGRQPGTPESYRPRALGNPYLAQVFLSDQEEWPPPKAAPPGYLSPGGPPGVKAAPPPQAAPASQQQHHPTIGVVAANGVVVTPTSQQQHPLVTPRTLAAAAAAVAAAAATEGGPLTLVCGGTAGITRLPPGSFLPAGHPGPVGWGEVLLPASLPTAGRNPFTIADQQRLLLLCAGPPAGPHSWAYPGATPQFYAGYTPVQSRGIYYGVWQDVVGIAEEGQRGTFRARGFGGSISGECTARVWLLSFGHTTAAESPVIWC